MPQKTRQRLLVLNDPHALRINKELAVEIGLNESIVLLQLDFLISNSTSSEYEGKHWTYQTAAGLHRDHFPFLSPSTIARAIKSLADRECIHIGNFNQHKYDRTQWFALNETGIRRLKSVSLLSDAIRQNDESILQNDNMDHVNLQNGSCQNDEPIPETTTKITTKTTTEERSVIAQLTHSTSFVSSASQGREPNITGVAEGDSLQVMYAVRREQGEYRKLSKDLEDRVTQYGFTDKERLARNVREWCIAGHSHTNIQGIRDWYDRDEAAIRLGLITHTAATPITAQQRREAHTVQIVGAQSEPKPAFTSRRAPNNQEAQPYV